MLDDEWLKHRTIALRCDSDCRARLIAILQTMDGVETSQWQTEHRLGVTYDLRLFDLDRLLDLVHGNGAELEGGSRQRLLFFLVRYMEAVQRETAQTDMGWDANLRYIYISRHRQRRKGHHEERLHQWRNYLWSEQTPPHSS